VVLVDPLYGRETGQVDVTTLVSVIFLQIYQTVFLLESSVFSVLNRCGKGECPEIIVGGCLTLR